MTFRTHETKFERILVFRLSSLGDILLATSFLENIPEKTQVDWVVRSEFEFALKGHPKIRNLIAFSKKDGLFGWIKLVNGLSKHKYKARVDLHRNLRTRFAFAFFQIFDLIHFNLIPHFGISKERVRTLFYFIFKRFTPKIFLPTPYWMRFGKVGLRLTPYLARHTQPEKLLPPSYLPVLATSGHDEKKVLAEYDLFPGKYFAVMPAASFKTKEWGTSHYRELIEKKFKGLTPVLLGRENDQACIQLKNELRKARIFFKDALTEPDFKKTAILLKYAEFYLGSDTGLAHLAEAVGTRSYVIFGPTRPELGFGPWKKESKNIYLPLACSPCSKDGKFCYRFFSPYACLRKLNPSEVGRKLHT